MLVAQVSAQRPVGLMALGDAFVSVIVTLAAAAVVVVLVASFLAERRETGEPSFVTRWALRLAAPTGRPIWDRLPFLVVLAGLAVALLGWRALTGASAFPQAGVPLAAIGLAVALLGGVMAGAMAHPPRSVVEHGGGEIAHPTPAHRVVVRRGRLGAGPVGGALVVIGGALALVVVPVAATFRVMAGDAAADVMPAHELVVAAVGLITVGAWLLHAEGTVAAQRRTGARQRGADLAEAGAATAALLTLSVAVDSGLPAVLGGVLGLAGLLLVRVRAGAGAGLLAVLGYLVARLMVAVLCWGFAAPLVPLWWQATAAAVSVELVGALVAVGRPGRRASSPASVG